MKELLHIPTGNIVKFRNLNTSDCLPKDVYTSFGEQFDETNFDREIRYLASGEYMPEFYHRNGIPNKCSQSEYLVIDV